MELQLGGGGNSQGKVLIRMRWERVILTLQLPPLAHGFPSQGPGPATRHLVVAEDGPLGLRQLLVETGTVQRGPVQPSRHRHSSGCSQKPCSALQPARHATMGDGEAEGKKILISAESGGQEAEKFLSAFCAPPCFILGTVRPLGQMVLQPSVYRQGN